MKLAIERWTGCEVAFRLWISVSRTMYWTVQRFLFAAHDWLWCNIKMLLEIARTVNVLFLNSNFARIRSEKSSKNRMLLNKLLKLSYDFSCEKQIKIIIFMISWVLKELFLSYSNMYHNKINKINNYLQIITSKNYLKKQLKRKKR